MPEALDDLIRLRNQLQQLCRSSVQHMLWEDPLKASQPYWDAMLLEPERTAGGLSGPSPDEPRRPLSVFSAKPYVERRASRSRSR